MTNLVDDAEDLEEIVESIIGLGKLKEKQNELQMKCEFVLGDAYEDEFRDKFDTSKNKISECIKGQKQKPKTLKQAAVRIEKEEMEDKHKKDMNVKRLIVRKG